MKEGSRVRIVTAGEQSMVILPLGRDGMEVLMSEN